LIYVEAVLEFGVMEQKNRNKQKNHWIHGVLGVAIAATLGIGTPSTSHAESAKKTVHEKGPVASGGVAGIYIPVEPEKRAGKKALIITDFEFNDMETFYPLYRFTEEGFDVTVASVNGGDIQGYGGHVIKDTVPVADVDVTEFDVLYLPGGRAPDKIRNEKGILEAVTTFAETGRPIAAICHGPQILVTADLVDGKNIACFADVGKEVQEAGGTYQDKAVVVDGQFVTSRLPKDLPVQMKTLLALLDQPRN